MSFMASSSQQIRNGSVPPLDLLPRRRHSMSLRKMENRSCARSFILPLGIYIVFCFLKKVHMICTGYGIRRSSLRAKSTIQRRENRFGSPSMSTTLSLLLLALTSGQARRTSILSLTNPTPTNQISRNHTRSRPTLVLTYRSLWS